MEDKQAIKSLEKFVTTLNNLDSTPEKPLNEEKQKELEMKIINVFGEESNEKDKVNQHQFPCYFYRDFPV